MYIRSEILPQTKNRHRNDGRGVRKIMCLMTLLRSIYYNSTPTIIGGKNNGAKAPIFIGAV